MAEVPAPTVPGPRGVISDRLFGIPPGEQATAIS
jgi:hypothetical protein